MEHALKILAPIAVALVILVLIAGLWNMVKGGSPSTSQNLMRMRIILQAIALAVLMAVLWFSGNGPV